MAANRREFVLGTPLGLAALFGEAAIATEILAAAEAHDPAALDFWTRGMGVSSSAIPNAQAIAGANPGEKGGNAGPSSVESFAKEPLFLHYSTMDNSFIPSDQIPKNYLLQSGDTKLDTQMQRLRLNTADNARFAKYTSGAIYFELQQAAAAASGSKSSSGLSDLASTVFSAFMPGTGKGTAKNGKKSGPPSATPNGQAGAPIPLQSKAQAQTLVLKNGGGKAAFTAFVKDPRKTLFGQFVSLMTASTGSDGPVYAQLLNIPLLSFPGVQSVRAIVANLHLQGSSQEIVMQSPPTDIATTIAALQKATSPLPLRAGDYLVVAREHGSITVDQLNKYKIMDGFLVPKEVKSEFDVTPELVQNAVPDLSYLTLGVGVKPTDASACAA